MRVPRIDISKQKQPAGSFSVGHVCPEFACRLAFSPFFNRKKGLPAPGVSVPPCLENIGTSGSSRTSVAFFCYLVDSFETLLECCAMVLHGEFSMFLAAAIFSDQKHMLPATPHVACCLGLAPLVYEHCEKHCLQILSTFVPVSANL